MLSDEASASADFTLPAAPDPADAAGVARALIAYSAARLVHSLPQLHNDADPEDVHRSRVAARRLRSELRTFGPLLERSEAAELRRDLQWLAGELGRVRDLDVVKLTLLALTASHPEIAGSALAGILRILDSERREALRILRRQFAGERAARLHETLNTLAGAQQPQLVASQQAIGAVVALARKPWRRLERAIAGLPANPTPAQLHRVRIKTKRVRYAAEALAPIVGGKAKKFAAAAAALQDVLGACNDAYVAARWVEHSAEGLDPSAAFGAGRVVQHLYSRHRTSHSDRQKTIRRMRRASGWLSRVR